MNETNKQAARGQTAPPPERTRCLSSAQHRWQTTTEEERLCVVPPPLIEAVGLLGKRTKGGGGGFGAERAGANFCLLSDRERQRERETFYLLHNSRFLVLVVVVGYGAVHIAIVVYELTVKTYFSKSVNYEL